MWPFIWARESLPEDFLSRRFLIEKNISKLIYDNLLNILDLLKKWIIIFILITLDHHYNNTIYHLYDFCKQLYNGHYIKFLNVMLLHIMCRLVSLFIVIRRTLINLIHRLETQLLLLFCLILNQIWIQIV